jgi:hypothetical protein
VSDLELDDATLAASTEPPRTRLGQQLGRLAKQSAIYGLGSMVSRLLAVLLLPLYTHYLTPSDYGKVAILTAWSAVLVIVLRAGISTAFFRFYFDAEDDAGRTRVVRTSFWFTMTMATAGLVVGLVLAGPISAAFDDVGAGLVRAAFVGIWAQMNYEQLTSLFRVEQRALGFGLASLANVLVTVVAMVVFVAVLHWHALGLIVGNFTGTLAIYLVLLAYRRYQLGLEFDRHLLREMNGFGMPLVPSALALWAINFVDRFLVLWLKGKDAVGVYTIGVQVSSAIVFLLFAFRTAWPAYAYSIKEDDEAKLTYGFVLTYLAFITCWISTALGVLAPWIVRVRRLHRRRDRGRARAQDAVQLGHHGPRGRAQHRPRPRPRAAARHLRRGARLARHLRGHVPRDGLERAARLSSALPVAADRDARGRIRSAHRRRSPHARPVRAGARPRACATARALPARVLPSGRASASRRAPPSVGGARRDPGRSPGPASRRRARRHRQRSSRRAGRRECSAGTEATSCAGERLDRRTGDRRR